MKIKNLSEFRKLKHKEVLFLKDVKIRRELEKYKTQIVINALNEVIHVCLQKFEKNSDIKSKILKKWKKLKLIPKLKF